MHGKLIVGVKEEQWCDRQNFAELYRREHGLLPWFQRFQILKRLEWQGEVRRGYFIEGLSGIQFALPEAVAMLEKLQTEEQAKLPQTLLIGTIDLALPFGGAVDWQMQDTIGNKITVVRSPSNHLVFVNDRPVLYSENYGSRLWQLGNIEQESLDGIARSFKTWLQLPANLRPRRRIEILQINNQPASESQLVEVFLRNGFERDGEKLVLWPSGV